MNSNYHTHSHLCIILRSITTAVIGVFLGGCASSPVAHIPTGQHSPVRMYLSEGTLSAVKQTLLLPPLGIDDSTSQKEIQQQLFSGARRHFIHPVQLVSIDSAYANYITERNLMNSNGTLNVSEVVMIGQLMNASHVICPFFNEIRPYHPQKISVSIPIVATETGEISGELSAVFDAKDRDVREWFTEYSKQHSRKKESDDDIQLKLRSPAAFQSFISDACFKLISESLPF